MSCTCGKEEASIKCGICNKLAYCCSSCENIGWSLHQNDCNIHSTIDEPHLTVFIPEDSDESHMVRYYDPKGFVNENFIGGKFRNTKTKKFGGGAYVNPDCEYQVTINGGKPIKVEPIFEAHDSKIIRQLAAITRRSKQAVFYAKNVNFSISQERLKISFYIDGKETTYLTGNLTDFENGNHIGKDEKKNKVLIHLKDGKIVHMYFSCPVSVVEKKQAYLPSTDVPNRLQFKCDASDIDHISGLVMALEDGMASGELQDMDNHFYVINAHREALEKDPTIVPSAKINAAIHFVTTALWNNYVDKSLLDRGQDFIQRIKDKRALKGITNNATLIEMLRDQIAEAEELQRGGQNATDNINYASNIASELRRRKVLASKNAGLNQLYTRLNVLVKSKGTKRLAKMKESRMIKKDKKKEYEQQNQERQRQRQLSRVPGMKDVEEDEPILNAGRRIKF